MQERDEMPRTVIEAARLEPLTIKCFNCPDQILSFSEIAEILSAKSDHFITEADVKEFRTEHMAGKSVVPVPLIDKSLMTGIPQTLEDMFQHAMMDTNALRTGAIHETFKIYRESRENENNKEALTAIGIMNKTADSLDTKLKQLSPTSDPASAVLGMDAFQRFKSVLWIIDRENPEFKLIEKYEAEVRKQDALDAV